MTPGPGSGSDSHWTTNGSATTWTYRNATAGGVTKAKVRSRAGVPGLTSVAVSARPLTIASPTVSTPPALAIVVLDPPYAVSGQCGTSAFTRCVAAKGGALFKCKP